jgi:hypothetical protein
MRLMYGMHKMKRILCLQAYLHVFICMMMMMMMMMCVFCDVAGAAARILGKYVVGAGRRHQHAAAGGPSGSCRPFYHIDPNRAAGEFAASHAQAHQQFISLHGLLAFVPQWFAASFGRAIISG